MGTLRTKSADFKYWEPADFILAYLGNFFSVEDYMTFTIYPKLLYFYCKQSQV